MKILWWSVASPFAPSAYAKITREMAAHLTRMGHEVHILAVSGLRWGEFDIGGVHIHGTPSGEVDGAYALDLFQDMECDVAVYVGDIWPWPDEVGALAENVPLVLHSPIDHTPVTEKEINVMRKAGALGVPAKWGVEQCRKAGLEADYVPHGVDLSIFQPYEGDRREIRESLGWDPDGFIFLMVATNRGCRKNIPLAMRAFSEISPIDIHTGQKRYLCLHTYPFRSRANPDGVNLDHLAKSLGIIDRIYWMDPHVYSRGLPEPEMAQLYQASDVLLMPSKAEGFGIPIIEAGACGIPSIVTDYSAMAELVDWERGWRIIVETYDIEQALDSAWMAMPRLYGPGGLQALMIESMHDKELLKQKGQAALEFAQGFTWESAASEMERVLRLAIFRAGERAVNENLALS